MGLLFWLRWSWRDLRKRTFQAIAIALILALGAGIYAGLGTTSVWRRTSLDTSLEALGAHDIRVEFLGGLALHEDLVASAIEEANLDSIVDIELRLIARAPVSTTHKNTNIAAAGLIVGVDTTSGPRIDRWQIVSQSSTNHTNNPGNDENKVLLDQHFANAHGLANSGMLRVGGTDVHYNGLALAPEYFNLTTTVGASIRGAATRAVIYAPIEVARDIAGQDGMVNDAAIRLAPGADAEAIARELQSALTSTLPIPVTVSTLDDDVSISSLRDEIDSEQRLFDVFALLVVAGAAFAAFSLMKRVVESQRRDIGNSMALGVPRYLIALRSMLLPAQIVLLGVVLGLVVAQGISLWVLALIKSTVPLPVWVTPSQPGLLAKATVLTIVIPIAATAIPVWRAISTHPVDALAAQHLRSGRHRVGDLFGRIPLPGTTLMQTPLRRILRAPARSTVTVLAISFIIGPLVAAFGATDSTTASLVAGDRASGANTLIVELQMLQSEAAASVQAVTEQTGVAASALGLDIGGFAKGNGTELGLSIAMADLSDPVAVPTELATQQIDPGGIVLSRKAARDLGVKPGDDIVLHHPHISLSGVAWADSTLNVRALHESPFRFVAYMDLADRSLMGLDGLVNSVTLQAADSSELGSLGQSTAQIDGVASSLEASSFSRTMRDILAMVDDLFVVLQLVIAALAFLVAFNASNVAADERRREHATMLAFGVPYRRVISLGIAESVLLGVGGVALGLVFGNALLAWILNTVFPAAVPDLAVEHTIGLSSYLIAIAIGLSATALAPLLNLRALRKMNLPSTLRFVE